MIVTSSLVCSISAFLLGNNPQLITHSQTLTYYSVTYSISLVLAVAAPINIAEKGKWGEGLGLWHGMKLYPLHQRGPSALIIPINFDGSTNPSISGQRGGGELGMRNETGIEMIDDRRVHDIIGVSSKIPYSLLFSHSRWMAKSDRMIPIF